jgi:hypothetical protein
MHLDNAMSLWGYLTFWHAVEGGCSGICCCVRSLLVFAFSSRDDEFDIFLFLLGGLYYFFVKCLFKI